MAFKMTYVVQRAQAREGRAQRGDGEVDEIVLAMLRYPLELTRYTY